MMPEKQPSLLPVYLEMNDIHLDGIEKTAAALDFMTRRLFL